MAKNNNTTIEINGKKYDAHTGNVVSHAAPGAHHKPKVKAKQPIKHEVARTPAKHTPAHQPTQTQTLMRSAVKKPANSPTALAKREIAGLEVKNSVSCINKQRLGRAAKIAKSQQIVHFSPLGADRPPTPAAEPVITPSKPAPAAHRAPRPSAIKRKDKTTSDIFEQALATANSHDQAMPKQARNNRRKRVAGIGGVAVMVVLLIGVIVAQNMPNMRLQMASAKAGFDAALPSYSPGGYSLGQLSYSQGAVATQFHSNSDNRAYTITQKQSAWNSQALQQEFVKQRDKNYQTVESSGQTIYLYGQNNATWVNGGIWYVIQTNGSLSNKQLVQLATSL